MAQGDAGVALMYAYFDKCLPGDGWDRVAHSWVERAAAGVSGASSGALFEGTAGLAFAVLALSRDGRRYRTLRHDLHDRLKDVTHNECLSLKNNIASSAVPFGAWDLISGVVGMGTYFLTVGDQENLSRIVDCLVTLTLETQGLPNWRTPAELSGQWMAEAYPGGHLNCGLAHGAPGIMAFLSLARLNGFAYSGLDEAIHRTALWISRQQLADAWGANWPAAIPLRECDGHIEVDSSAHLHPMHAGWCYGAPGVARALWLAGTALENPTYRTLGFNAIKAVVQRPDQALGLSSPALCHGFAGLLCIALRFHHDTRHRQFLTFARRMVRRLEAMHEPDALVGYRTTEPGGARIDQVGFLDGAPGVAMALLAGVMDHAPNWDRSLLLA